MQVIPKHISGIYSIVNKTNNKFYIGSAVDIRERIYIHFGKLRKNQHHSSYLQSAYNKYGESNFDVKILSTCPKEYLIKLEQWFIDTQKPNYNICKVAGSLLGITKSESSKQKLRETHKRKFKTEGTRKLNLQQIEEIKQLLLNGELQINIANNYNVSVSVISKLKNKLNIDFRNSYENRKSKNKYEKYPESYINELKQKLKNEGCSVYKFIKDNNLKQTFYKLLK